MPVGSDIRKEHRRLSRRRRKCVYISVFLHSLRNRSSHLFLFPHKLFQITFFNLLLPEFNSILYALFPCSERSEEHTSELQSLMRISYDVFCLKKKKNNTTYK